MPPWRERRAARFGDHGIPNCGLGIVGRQLMRQLRRAIWESHGLGMTPRPPPQRGGLSIGRRIRQDASRTISSGSAAASLGRLSWGDPYIVTALEGDAEFREALAEMAVPLRAPRTTSRVLFDHSL